MIGLTKGKMGSSFAVINKYHVVFKFSIRNFVLFSLIFLTTLASGYIYVTPTERLCSKSIAFHSSASYAIDKSILVDKLVRVKTHEEER